MNQNYFYSIVSVITVSLMLSSGCSKPGGGASADVQVQPKPRNIAMFEAEEEETNQSGGTKSKVKGKQGTFTGQIIIEGNVPALKLLVTKNEPGVKDGATCAAADIPNEEIVISKEGALANVYIYLAKAPKGFDIPKASKKKIPFDNIGCRFKPHVLFARTGQTIMMKNKDPVAHNTHTLPSKNTGFNGAVSAQGVPLIYETAEKVPVFVKCDYHSWMTAYHLPLDHPYAAITDKDGKFKIKNVPPGKHEFKIWHESAGLLNKAYKVTIDGNQEVKITFTPKQLQAFHGPVSKTIRLSALP